MGDRAFSSCAPKLWNSLPSEIRQAESFSVFKSVLKTYFFRIAVIWKMFILLLIVIIVFSQFFSSV